MSVAPSKLIVSRGFGREDFGRGPRDEVYPGEWFAGLVFLVLGLVFAESLGLDYLDCMR